VLVKIRVTEKEREGKELGVLTRTEWTKESSYLRERLLYSLSVGCKDFV